MYLTLKALHIISMVAWFAGLFYIFRLFVYHRQQSHRKELSEVFVVMESKLLRIIIAPASVATLGFGLAMIYFNPWLLRQGWLWLKLAFVLGLYGYQWLSFRTAREFAKNHFIWTEKQCRFWNEAPTVVLIVVIFLAILKPLI